MKILLIGSIVPSSPIPRALRALGHDVKVARSASFVPLDAFVQPPSTDLIFSSTQTIHDLVSSLSPWHPEIGMIFPEYTDLPFFLEEAPFPLLCVAGDWNLCYTVDEKVVTMVDAVAANGREVLEKFKKLGVKSCLHSVIMGWDDEVFFRGDDERPIDLAFVGNLSPAIHKGRGRNLERLVTLSDRYRVFIKAGMPYYEVGKVYRNSRLVFNQSIRNEINMRFYEGVGSGGGMLLEKGNPQVQEYFREGEEYVGYPQEGLEETIAHCLSGEDERKRIARNGYERLRAGQHTYRDIFRKILDYFFSLPGLPASGARDFKEQRIIFSRSVLERKAFWAYVKGQAVSFPAAVTAWEDLLTSPDWRGVALHNLGILSSSSEDPAMREEGIKYLKEAASLSPSSFPSWFSLGQALKNAGKGKEAQKAFQVSLELEEELRGDLSPFLLYFPIGFHEFHIALQSAYREERLTQTVRELLRRQALQELAGYSFHSGALERAGELLAADTGRECAGKGKSYFLLGRMKEEEGKILESAGYFQKACFHSPLDFHFHLKHLSALLEGKILDQSWEKLRFLLASSHHFPLGEEGRRLLLSSLEEVVRERSQRGDSGGEEPEEPPEWLVDTLSALLFLTCGMIKEACWMVGRSLQLAPDEELPWLALAEVANREERLREAVEALQRARDLREGKRISECKGGLPASLYSRMKELTFSIGNGYFLKKNYEEALQLYTILLKEGEESPVLLNNAAACLARLGNYAEALQAYEEAIRMNPALKEAVAGSEVMKSLLGGMQK